MMTCARSILGLGALLILGGFAAIAVGGWVGLWGLWLVVGGLVIVAAICSSDGATAPWPPKSAGAARSRRRGAARRAARAALQPDNRTLRGPDDRRGDGGVGGHGSGDRRYRADR